MPDIPTPLPLIIPPGGLRLPEATLLLVLDPASGLASRPVGLLAVGAHVLVQAAGEMCFRPVSALERCEAPMHVTLLPSGDLALDAMQPVGDAIVGSRVDAVEYLHGAQAFVPPLPWVMVTVDGADRLIFGGLAVATGPVPDGVVGLGTNPVQAFVGPHPLDVIEIEALPGQIRLEFKVPPRTTTLRLLSRRAQPEGDGRRLGVAITGLQLGLAAVALDSPGLVRGFHQIEQRDGLSWRWTDGEALMIVPPCPVEQILSVKITDWHIQMC